MNISKLDFYFKHPSTIIVSGPTQSGKTFFVKKVLEQQLITPFPTRIVWVFKRWQPNYDEIKLMLPNTEFVQGYSDNLDEYFDPLENNLLIIDDQMEQAGSSKTLSSLFTVGSHHLNLSVIYLVQNQFDKGKSSRSVGLNAHYNVLFRNTADMTQSEMLFRRRGKRVHRWLAASFDDATAKPYGYLILDNRPETPSRLRCRSGLLHGEVPVIYEDSLAPSV